MPCYVVKIAPDRDEYVYWSTITECPYFYGTRAEIDLYLTERGENGPYRLDNADKYGTSSVHHFYDWNTTEFITEQRGLVKRSDLAELTRCLAEDEPYPHILHPFEDGHMVGWGEKCAHCNPT